jgi:hypothetical protein
VQRYRTIFKNEEIEIAVDRYPFGIALEIENKMDDCKGDTIKKPANHPYLLTNNTCTSIRMNG